MEQHPNGSKTNTNDINNQQKQIMQFIEACNLLNDAQNEKRIRGEKYLMDISRRASPYDLCLSVLEVTNESHVEFQALRTICDSLLNEWCSLSVDSVDCLREKLLLFAVNYRKIKSKEKQRKLSGFVLNELAKCVAIMFKRKWRISDDSYNRSCICSQILSSISKLLRSSDPYIAVIGLTLSNELIEEFSVNHASSALGLTWDFHIKCHRGFERFCLQNLFELICKLFHRILGDMVSIHAENDSISIKSTSAIFSAMTICCKSSGNIIGESVFEMMSMTAMVICKCLSFNFHEKTSDDKLLLAFTRNVYMTSHNELLRPGPSWKHCLIDDNLLKLFNIWHNVLYRWCRDNDSQRLFSSTLRILREIIISIHSLSGHIFDTKLVSDDVAIDTYNDDDDSSSSSNRNRKVRFKLDASITHNQRLKGMDLVLNRIPFVRECVSCLSSYIWSIDNKNSDRDLVTDICRMLQALCRNFRYELLISCSAHVDDGWTQFVFNSIRDLSHLLIAHMNVTDDSECVWSNESFDILMGAITCLINCYEIRKHNLAKQSQCILSMLSSMTESIFIEFVNKSLDNAQIEIAQNVSTQAQYKESDYLNERLIGIAMIGRVNSRCILPFLCSKIKHLLSQFVLIKKECTELSVIHEKLYLLFQFLGYTLSDDPRGEQTKIPNILMNNDDDNDDVLISAIYPLFEWITIENSYILNNEKHLLSPLLAQSLIAMLSRWCSCYLMPNVAYYEHISLGLLSSFGCELDGASGMKILDLMIAKCARNIFSWREERDVVTESCLMLQQFVKHSSIRPYLYCSQSFNELILNKYCSDSLNLHLLRPPHLISMLIRIILQSVMGGEEDANNKCAAFDRITTPIYNSFMSGCAPFAQHPTKSFYTSEQYNNLEISIYKLHGISQTFSHFTFDFMFGKGIFEILIQIICKFSNHYDNNIVLIIFKIFADISEISLIDLDKAQSKSFLALCVQLMREFESHNASRMKQHSMAYIDKETREKYQEMQCDEIMVILKLLEFMSTKDLIDINLDKSGDDFYGECIFKSFYYLTPSVNSETLFEFKSLRMRFYEVLSICIRGFTQTFATKLNNEQRNAILGDKIFESLQCAQYEIIEFGLEIIQCFAEYQLEHNCATFNPYLKESIHSLFMLLIDIKTPKLLYPKLCETLLPVLIAAGKDQTTAYLHQFINNICEKQTQKEKLANVFSKLIAKINQLNVTKSFVIQMKTKAQFREYFIALTHKIRTIVSLH